MDKPTQGKSDITIKGKKLEQVKRKIMEMRKRKEGRQGRRV